MLSPKEGASKPYASPYKYVEYCRRDAGIHIGSTLTCMHLKRFAVFVILSVKTIGKAPVTAARTGPEFIVDSEQNTMIT